MINPEDPNEYWKREKLPIIQLHHDITIERCLKPSAALMEEMTPDKIQLLHLASKLCAEAGELMDAIGKHCFYNQPLDLENVREELGDLAFYEGALMRECGLTWLEVFNANTAKLARRYPHKFSNEAAKARADKAPDAAQDRPFTPDEQRVANGDWKRA
jgi:NTP pyrophosphatase (non-canonical NTP hydrolase)